MSVEQLKELAVSSPAKIVLLVMDGLGGLPAPETGKTELETARTPNLDRLAESSTLGLTEPVSPGITPGSGPAHLALFGYDPLRFDIGRGVLEALGIDFDLQPEDLAARGNFCTMDEKGLIVDRRAGRLPTSKAAELCRRLDGLSIDGVRIIVQPVQEHRFAVVFRGEPLDDRLSETDPQREGVPPRTVVALAPQAERGAIVANSFIAQAKETLADSSPANMVMLRGFSRLPHLPSLGELYGLRAGAIATYPMYRGLAKLVGMTVLATGATLANELATLEEQYPLYDFFYLHVKKTDTTGEDGDFLGKVGAIEEVDGLLPRLLNLKPEVLVVTGDHSTPALLKGHSWHPVPFLLSSPWCRPDGIPQFSERACARGSLGRFSALQAMPLALANALKLTKYGA
ncbi:MAG: 2,3-bisphosphoglycerate-independent phosphoglycerate mutase [Chloroflexi bacterium]|nr:2,3-bisphosphoglycerate-independent phosphoglycerate mutase [Chloroflexota bacterium]